MRSTMYMYRKKNIVLAGTGVWKISYVACGFSSFKIDYMYYDCQKSLISRINEIYVFIKKNPYSDILLKNYNRLSCCNHTCYYTCVNMVSMTSA